MVKSFQTALNSLNTKTDELITLINPIRGTAVRTQASGPLTELSEAELKELVPLSLFRLKGKDPTALIYVPGGEVVRVYRGELEVMCCRAGSLPGLWTKVSKLDTEVDAVLWGMCWDGRRTGAYSDQLKVASLKARLRVPVHTREPVVRLEVSAGGGTFKAKPAGEWLDALKVQWEPTQAAQRDGCIVAAGVDGRPALAGVQARRLSMEAVCGGKEAPDNMLVSAILHSTGIASEGSAGLWDVAGMLTGLVNRPEAREVVAVAWEQYLRLDPPDGLVEAVRSLVNSLYEVLERVGGEAVSQAKETVAELDSLGLGADSTVVGNIIRQHHESSVGAANSPCRVSPASGTEDMLMSRARVSDTPERAAMRKRLRELEEASAERAPKRSAGRLNFNVLDDAGGGGGGTQPGSPQEEGPTERYRGSAYGDSQPDQGGCFKQLVPEHAPERTAAGIISRLEEATGATPGSLASVLAQAVGRKQSSTRSMLFPSTGAFAAEQAAEDWEEMVRRVSESQRAHPGWDRTPASSWLAGAKRLEMVFEAMDLLTEEERANSSTDPITSKMMAAGMRHKITETSATSDGADAATPADLLQQLTKSEVWKREMQATYTRDKRSTVEEVQRVVSSYGAPGWACVFSDGKVLGKLGDDYRIPACFGEARLAMAGDLERYVESKVVGPAPHQREQARPLIRSLVAGIIHGAMSLEVVVKLLGMVRASSTFTVEGAVAGQMGEGRLGDLHRNVMTDVPRALTRLAELLELAHVQAGGGKAPACKQFKMADFWTRVSEDLPTEDSELPGGSVVFGAISLAKGMIKRINLAMVDKRRNGSPQPLDIERVVEDYERSAVGPAVDKARLTAVSRAVMRTSESKEEPKAEQTERQRKRAEKRRAHKERQRVVDPPETSAEANRAASQRLLSKPPGESLKGPGSQGGDAARADPAWLTYAPNSLAQLVGGRRQGVVEAFEAECRKAYPNLGKSFWPCAFEELTTGGCRKDSDKEPCQNCANQLARKEKLPPPEKAVQKIYGAASEAVRRALSKPA